MIRNTESDHMYELPHKCRKPSEWLRTAWFLGMCLFPKEWASVSNPFMHPVSILSENLISGMDGTENLIPLALFLGDVVQFYLPSVW